LLSSLNIRFTKKKLDEILQSHVDYPTLLSLKDCLSEYGVRSAAVSRGNHALHDFETPFICSIQKEEWPYQSFTIVVEGNTEFIRYLSPINNAIEEIATAQFELMDKGIVLLIDESTKKDEANFSANKIAERTDTLINTIPLYLVLIIYAVSSAAWISNDDLYGWVGFGFLTSSTIGFGFSALLVLHEVDSHSPILKEVCGGAGKKTNCNAVLNSRVATFLGLSWTIWGFSFMSTVLFSQIFFINQLPYLVISCVMSVIVSPYIFFSIYHQLKIKQWCSLCLGIQVVLGVNLVLSLAFLQNFVSPLTSVNYQALSIILFLGMFFLLAGFHLIPTVRRALGSNRFEKSLNRMRYNPEIFRTLLNNQPQIAYSSEGLGIVIGNPNATNEIIKVCNPYCNPCAQAHSHLEQIIKSNSDFKMRIIFTVSGEDGDMKTAPVSHLLNIQNTQGSVMLERALDDWYSQSVKDYAAFAELYPVKEDFTHQKERLVAMRDWCDNMKIRVTPTLFINGRELPETYTIKELKNIF